MSDVLVLIPTCTAFADTWAPGIACLRKFWTDCAYDVVWMNDGEKPDVPLVGLWPGRVGNRVFASRSLSSRGWCKRILAEEWIHPGDNGNAPWKLILMFLDDMFLCAPPDEARLDEAISLMRGHAEIDAIQLYHRDDCVEMYGQSIFFRLAPGAPYPITTGPCLWRPSALRRAAALGGTAWDFELRGSREAPKYTVLSCGAESVMPVQYTAITRGEWEPGALEFLRREGIAVDASRRGTRGQ